LCIRDHDDDDDGGARQHPELLLFKDATFSILFRIEIHKQTCCGPSSFVFVLLREQWVKKSRHMACLSYQTSYPLRAPLRSLKNERKKLSLERHSNDRQRVPPVSLKEVPLVTNILVQVEESRLEKGRRATY